MSLYIPPQDLNAWFCIREGTRNEYLTAAPDGRVVRWAAEGPDGRPSDRQRWFISLHGVRDEDTRTVKENRYRIQNLATKGFLHLGHQAGFGWYWCTPAEPPEAESSFAFEFTDLRWSADASARGPFQHYVNIREFSQNEFLAVGDNGWAIRWGRTGGDSQRFYLQCHEPLVELPRPAAPQAVIDRVPGPRLLRSLDDIPSDTEDRLVGEEILPSALVHDARYPDPLTQVQAGRWYRLQHFQGYALPRDGGVPAVTFPAQGVKSSFTAAFRTLFRREELEGLEETFMWQVSGEVTGSFQAQKGAEDARKSGSGSAKLAFTVGKSITQFRNKRENYEQETVRSQTFDFETQGRSVRVAMFVLQDRYVLSDSQGREVRTWRVCDGSSLIIRSFPEDAATTARSG